MAQINLNVLLYLLYHEHNLVDNHQVFVWILNRWHPPLDFLVIRTVNRTERAGFYFYSDTITVSSCICPRLIPLANCLI